MAVPASDGWLDELWSRASMASDVEELAVFAVELFVRWSGCEAGALRLTVRGDYPYVATVGLSDAFVEAERSLLPAGCSGVHVLDGRGAPRLECICGVVSSDVPDDLEGRLTPYGSFCSGDLAAEAAVAEALEPRGFRNRCGAHGYRTVALVPLRRGADVHGLVQLVDRRTDLLDADAVEMAERLARVLTMCVLRQRRLDELVAAEATYSEIVEEQSELVCRWRPDGTLTYVNRAYETFFGRPRSELVGTAYFDLVPEDQHVAISTHIARLLRTGGPLEMVHQAVGRDGVTRWQRWRDKVIERADGQVEILSVGRDIHADVEERRTLELRDELSSMVALTASRLTHGGSEPVLGRVRGALTMVAEKIGATFGALFEATEPGILVPTVLGHGAGPRAGGHAMRLSLSELPVMVERLSIGAPIHLLSRDDLSGESPGERALIEAHDIDEAIMVPWIVEGVLLGCLMVVASGGRSGWQPIHVSSLHIIAELVFFAVDNERAWERERTARAAVASSEERLSTIFGAMSGGMIVADLHDRLVLVNDAARRILEVSPDTVLEGRHVREALPQAIPLLAEGAPGMQHRLTLTREDRRTVDIGFTTTRDPASGLMTCSFRDLTSVVELDKRRQRAEQLAQVGELAAKLSHEIKNPLATISWGLKLLAQEVEAVHVETIAAIEEEVQKLSETIRELLDASKTSPFAPSVMRLGESVRRGIAPYGAFAAGHGVTIELDGSEEDTEILVDDRWLHRILGNLVINAVEATGRGGRVEVRWGRLAEQARAELVGRFASPVCRIVVADDGPGIPSEVAAKVFSPFVTTKPSGTGLGLTVVQELVEAMGGVVHLDSTPGSGTRVQLLLPVAVDEPCWRSYEGTRGTACASIHCHACVVMANDVRGCCWAIIGKGSKAEKGTWPASCWSCNVFLERNLASAATMP